MKKRLLVLYASYGTGHKSISNYINDYFTKSGEYEVLELDLLHYATPLLGPFTDRFYNNVMYKFPWIWNAIYYSTDNMIGGKVSVEFQSKVVSNKKIKKVIDDFNPDLIVSTHHTATI